MSIAKVSLSDVGVVCQIDVHGVILAVTENVRVGIGS